MQQLPHALPFVPQVFSPYAIQLQGQTYYLIIKCSFKICISCLLLSVISPIIPSFLGPVLLPSSRLTTPLLTRRTPSLLGMNLSLNTSQACIPLPHYPFTVCLNFLGPGFSIFFLLLYN